MNMDLLNEEELARIREEELCLICGARLETVWEGKEGEGYRCNLCGAEYQLLL